MFWKKKNEQQKNFDEVLKNAKVIFPEYTTTQILTEREERFTNLGQNERASEFVL